MTRRGSIDRLIVIGLAMLLSACASGRGGTIPYDVSNFGAPDAPKLASASEVYKLGPLDTVIVKVFAADDLSQEYTIDQGGHLTMPLLGQINAVGLSTSQLADIIARGLNEKYMRNPNVVVALKESASQMVTVEGSVHQPGIYPFSTTSLTLLQAIALAHGADDLANLHRVAIFRTIGGKQMAAAFDLTQIRRGEVPNPIVYPGDMVVVDGSGVAKAKRDVLQAIPLASIFMAL